VSAQAQRPSAIARLGITGAPERAAKIAPPAPAAPQRPLTSLEPAHGGPTIPAPQFGAWRRVVELEGRKYTAALRKERARWGELTEVINQARAAGASEEEISAGLVVAGIPQGGLTHLENKPS
jgi:hypothetical protein